MLQPPEIEIPLLWNALNELKKEDKQNELSAAQKEAIRGFVWDYLKKWVAVVAAFASIASFVGGFAAQAIIKSETESKVNSKLLEWAKQTADANATAREAFTAIQEASAQAREAAQRANRSAESAQKNQNLVTGAAELIANRLTETDQGKEFRKLLIEESNQEIATLKRTVSDLESWIRPGVHPEYPHLSPHQILGLVVKHINGHGPGWETLSFKDSVRPAPHSH